MITKEHLQKILSDTESYHIEKTVATDNMDKFSQAICAFSNDVADSKKKGYLLIGVRDNGELAGLQVDDKLLLQISNIRTDGNILPQPVMTVEKFSFAQGDVLVVEVTPSQVPPVRYRGRIWVRVGPRKSIATEAEEKLLTERRLSNIRTFDAMPCLGTTLEDLDITLFKKEYLFKAVAEDILQEDKRTIEEQMASLGLYDLRYQCPTNAAIVLFGNNPECFLHGAYIHTLSGGERRRLYLLRLLMTKPNVLLLDEPTNDLDIDTLTVLEDFLQSFNGAVLIVSHDRYFLDKTVEQLFVIRGEGQTELFYGSMSDYLEQEKSLSKVVVENPKVEKSKEETTKLTPAKKMTYQEKKEWETIETMIQELEEKLESLQIEMNANAQDFAKLQALQEELDKTEEAAANAYERWEYLAELAGN